MTGYRYGCVARLTMDDPCNDHLDEGDLLLVPGKNEDGHSYTVLDDEKEGFTDVECEVVARYDLGRTASKETVLEHTWRRALEDDVAGVEA